MEVGKFNAVGYYIAFKYVLVHQYYIFALGILTYVFEIEDEGI